ncbi:MAG TPA: response regulator [Burkholderiales bacterium]|nr:response regulator [Burkholderiales bacterium]
MNEGGHFSLSVRVDERDALVTVVDDGASIPNDVLMRALELALARRFTERSYTARVPLENRAQTSPMPPPTYRASPRRRILVVDDNVDAAQSLGLLLKQMGHDVQVVHDGHAALEAARINRPHLVLLDISMPGVDGYQVVERLRSDASFVKVLFVAVTAQGDEQARERSRQAGFAEHLVKPVGLDTLRRVLERL